MIRLSFSSLQLFQKCKRYWYKKYIEGLPEDLEERTPAMVIGSAVHYALERWRFYGGDRNQLVEWATEYAINSGINLTNRQLEDLRTLVYGISLPQVAIGVLLGVELELYSQINDDIAIAGIIDKVERVNDTIIVTDYKTNRKPTIRPYLQQLAVYDQLINENLPIEDSNLDIVYELFFVRYNRKHRFRISSEYREKVLNRIRSMAVYINENKDNQAAWPKLDKRSNECRWCPLRKECWG